MVLIEQRVQLVIPSDRAEETVAIIVELTPRLGTVMGNVFHRPSVRHHGSAHSRHEPPIGSQPMGGW